MKLTIPRLFDAARLLATDAGQKMEEFINFSQTAFEQLIRALRNNLTFEDNLKCNVLDVTLKSGKDQKISVSGNVRHVICTRVFPGTGIEKLTTPFHWYLDGQSNLVVSGTFTSSDPTADTNRNITVRLIVLFA